MGGRKVLAKIDVAGVDISHGDRRQVTSRYLQSNFLRTGVAREPTICLFTLNLDIENKVMDGG